jgi:ribosomal silencing factor RsfS
MSVIKRMDKHAVQKLIDAKSERVVYETYDGKSSVWKSFVLVTVDGQKLPYVKRSKCNTALKWKSKDGTSSLSGHLESCSSKGLYSTTNVKITDMPGFAVSATSSEVKVPLSVKSQMAAEIVKIYATDIRPFSIIEGQGFRAVAQKLISIGAQYGSVNVADVILCATTVSRHMQSVVTSSKSELREKMMSVANVAITTDGWTHSLTSQQYITTSVHFIDDAWNMNSHILATRLADEKHMADYIKKIRCRHPGRIWN